MIGPSLPGREIIRVKGLGVAVGKKGREKVLLQDVDFSLNRGEIHGLVGESGCGKSLLARTLVRLEAPARIVSGSIFIDGIVVAGKKPSGDFRGRNFKGQGFRGRKISLVLQNPAAAMDPLFTMASQFRDALSLLSKKEQSMDRVYGLLEEMGIASPASRCRQYPHEWSRGMLQRAQLVMALLSAPEAMILDEVTSALDPTIALQLIEFIARLRQSRQTAFLLITHDLALAAHVCDRISVMRRGSILETRDTEALFKDPGHGYTKEFIAGTGIEQEFSRGEAPCPIP